MLSKHKPKDPRLYQIGVLACLLIYGLSVLDFEVGISFAGLIIASALATQVRLRGLFDRQTERKDRRVVFLEYA